MKKFKKLLAGLLAGAMMLGSMTTTAFADEGAGETKRTVTPATINTELKGSLTIHKYEYNDTNEVEGADRTGTGEATDANKVPKNTVEEETGKTKEGAKPLAGAGFTIYKVEDVNNLTNYYSANPTNLPDVTTYVDNGKIKGDYSNRIVGKEVKTNADGIAAFTELELGFYVVIETTTPDKVTTPVSPFLVSIPMTTVNGDDWLYDVHVFPKNKTTYGGVKLEKKGNNTTLLSGVTFVLHKKNGNTWTNVTTKESDDTALELTTDENGQINVDGLSKGTYRFIETDRGTNYGYIMDGATAYQFIVNANGTITYGNETNANITISVNNEKPDMTKTVKDRRNSNNWKQDADYNVGDMVPYKITIDVPSNITKLKEFTLTDTPTNLQDSIQTSSDTSESFIVKYGDNPITNETGKVIYAVTRSGANGFEIKFTPSNMSEYAGKKIVIEYNAKLLAGAVTTTAGNPNTAKLEYSNKILPETDDGSNPNKPNSTPGKDSIEDSAIVYTFNLKISKKANKVDGDSLGGVKFDLYKYTGTEPNPTEADLKGTDGKLLKGGLETSSENTNRGTVSYPGLANGIYYLVETKTVDGYNLLKEPVKVTLNITYKTSMSDSWSWVNNNGTSTLVKHKIDNSKTEFSGNDTSNPTYGTHTETIINKNGFTLPTTGGMGTVIFSVLGIALVLAGLLVISASRKKAAK